MMNGKSSMVARLELQSPEETTRRLAANGKPHVFISETSLPVSGRVEPRTVKEHFGTFSPEQVSFARVSPRCLFRN